MEVYEVIYKNVVGYNDELATFIFDTYEKAKSKFDALKNEQMQHISRLSEQYSNEEEFLNEMRERGWDGVITDDYFDVYEDGYAADNETVVYIANREVL